MSPKSLLRHPKVISPIEDFMKGGFKEVIGDSFVTTKSVKRVIMCTGKIYYELLEEQQNNKRKDVAIIRIEQLHPFPKTQVKKLLEKYKNAEVYWVQEEPENMGSWAYLLRTIPEVSMKLVSRKASASPAIGYGKMHTKEQAEIINKAFE